MRDTIFQKALLRLLRPLARIMLRHGLSSYDFSRIANIAFVHAAGDILNEQGKPVSFSRISTITGLHRHVVSNIVNSEASSGIDPASEKDYRRNRLARVLSGWFESPEFTDAEGRPRDLPLDGPEPSFASLVRSFSGDIYPKIILDELLAVGAVQPMKDGSLRAITRRYIIGGAEPEAIEHLGMIARDFFGTLEHNLSEPAESRLFSDGIVTTSLDAKAIPLFRRLLRRRGSAFLEDIEGWIREHELPNAPEGIRAGIMMQMFIDRETPGNTTPDDNSRD